MSSDGGSDMAANAWPGFVDILSAVVIMFVFFVLITAAVLYFYTITYQSKVEGQPVEAVVEDITPSSVEQKVVELEKENQELKEQIEAELTKRGQGGGASESEALTDTESVAQAFGEQASEQEVLMSREEQTLVLFHDPGAITVNNESEEKITEFVAELAAIYGEENLVIELTSPKAANAETQSREKRLGVARMLNVRNSLLTTAIGRENIQLKIVESEEIESSENWTRLNVKVRK